ncbi:MAG: DUF4139 domain-containing protein [Phycisphaerae bacterium]|nr:DUF4139 domain-containing protein [Phycisphaerae bacterium]
MKRLTLALFAAASLATVSVTTAAAPAKAAKPLAQPPSGTTITIYSSADPAAFNPQQWVFNQQVGYNNMNPSQIPGFGVVKEVREMNLKAGLNHLDFTNVAALIDPTSVSFQDLSIPKTSVWDQRFKFDLVNSQKILSKYLGHSITLYSPVGLRGVKQITGKLLHAGNSLVVQTRHGLRILHAANLQQIHLGKLPRGLMTKPTLEWLVDAPVGGKQKILTSYQTKGLTWIADYNLVLNSANTAASLSAWVTILNLSGKTYRHAHLKLIAGNVNRVQQPQPFGMMALRRAAQMENAAPAFREKAFFEYHMYTLPRRTTIHQNSTQQIALFPTKPHIAVQKEFIYSGQSTGWWGYYGGPNLMRNNGIQSTGEIGVYVRFNNNKRNSLGIPFPKGKMRVYQADPADGTLEFLGEDLIHNTPVDEPVMVKVGKAFDIIGKRVQTNFDLNNAGKTLQETFQITLDNHGKTAAHILVQQYLWRWSNWKIVKNSDKFKKINAREIEFPVNVPADNGKKIITYTVRYSWR